MKKIDEIKVRVEFTEGWEKRFAKAAFNLYQRIEDRKEIVESDTNKIKAS